VRPARQFVQVGHHRLGDTAARTQEVPAQLQQAGAGRFQAELDDLERGRAPVPGEPEGPDLCEIDFLGAGQMLAEAPGEAVAVAGGLDPGDAFAQAFACSWG
jgi:hypothetical protein